MTTGRLLSMIALASLVAASACEQRANVDAPPRTTVERATTVGSQPRAVERAPSQQAAPEPVPSGPTMSAPPLERINESRPRPIPTPPPATPTPAPSSYEDGCGRPLNS